MRFWAKTSVTGDYLPLDRHLHDAAAVAARLWDLALTARQRSWLAAAAGASVDDARRLVVFLAAAHDSGKLSPTFQGLVPGLARQLLGGSLPLGGDGMGSAIRHDGISGALLTSWLTDRGAPRDTAERLAATVSGHHGTPRPAAVIRKDGRFALLRARQWRLVQDALVEGLAGAYFPGAGVVGPPGDAAVLALAGLVSVSDWLASDVRRFPVTSGDREASAVLAESAVVESVWGPRPVPDVRTFDGLFGFAPRASQSAMIDALADLSEPALIVLEDRTGSGKTEAALWAVLRGLQSGARGFYIGLPTRATANQFHSRTRRFVEAVWPDADACDVRLLHGGAQLRDDDPAPSGTGDASDDAAARAWFAAARRGLLSPYAVGTVDQALMAVLDARHYPVRLWGLHGKVVVLDEVHAYDTYTGLLLSRLVSWLGALGCSVVLLSATLPARRREALADAFRAGVGAAASSPDAPSSRCAHEYPRLTVTTTAGTTVTAIADDRPGREVALIGSGVADDDQAVAAVVLADIAGGGCAAVVCSTVALAQARFAAVRAVAGPEVTLLLLHARMRPLERAPVEDRLVAMVGPAGADRPDRLVVVATQVIEQSLDLDFDVVFTDLAPVDLLIQRAGRVHRHAGRARPEHHVRPRLVVLDTLGHGATRALPQGAGRIYVHAVLARTRVILRGRGVVREPEDLDALVEGVYGVEIPPGAKPDEQAAITDWDATAASDARALGGWAEDAAIGVPHAEVRPWELRAEPLADPDAPLAEGRNSAATRWSERPSISVVVLAHGEEALATSGIGAAATRALLERAVSLSAPAVVRPMLAQQEAFQLATWRQSGALRHHFLVQLDEAGRARPGRAPGADVAGVGLALEWDAEYGVRI